MNDQKIYNHSIIEPKWQKFWEENKTFRAVLDTKKPKYYVLDMFPYPSGAGLHVGHPEGYTATDIISRKKRMEGYNVLHPMGWDAFGLPAENYAIKTGTHPRITTEANIKNFTRQIKSLGFSYDWDREVNTTDPNYYKWTQWIFLQLYNSYFDKEEQKAKPIEKLREKLLNGEISLPDKEGLGGFENQKFSDLTEKEQNKILAEYRLAYETKMPINFCPHCKVGLANEEVENGKHERCGNEVVRMNLRQWCLRITKYAERLLKDLDTENLDWPEKIKAMQRNWIGKSEGCDVDWKVADHDDIILSTFTTTVDTIYGVTFAVISPEHPVLSEIITEEEKKNVEQYITDSQNKSDLERTELNKDKTGVFTGAYLIHPFTEEKIPLYIADYVLMSYGTGVVMGVPAHDQRDMDFAKKYNIPIVQSVVLENGDTFVYDDVDKYKVKGEIIDSGEFTGLGILEGRKKITQTLEDRKQGTKKIQYKLRDWIFSRQRYWGEPIPIVHCEECGTQSVSPLLDYTKKGSIQRHSEGTQRAESTSDLRNASSNNKKGAVDQASYDAQDGDPYVLPNMTPIYATILGKKIILCKKKSSNVFKKLGIFKKAPSVFKTHLGIIHCDWSNLARHFIKKPGGIEVYMRTKWRDVVIEILENASLDTIIKNERGYILRGLSENGKVVNVILGKKETEDFYVKTFFSVQDFSEKIFPYIPQNVLPLTLPDVEKYEPSGTGESPLANITEWLETECPTCGGKAKRETNTMPQWAGSSWYWLRFMDPQNSEEFCSEEAEKYFGPVDLYVGGAEHAVLHLLYSRFWHKVLFDLGYVSSSEPFTRLMNQGLILAEDGVKMSKSFGNVVNPDEIVEKYGADTLRVYEMFMGPFEQNKAWSTGAVEGIYKFLSRVYRVFSEKKIMSSPPDKGELERVSDFEKLTHKTIKKVTEDTDNFKFNTAISQLMIWTNEAQKMNFLPESAAEKICKLISPYSPHLAEEIWNEILKKNSGASSISTISYESWPQWSEEFAKDDEIELAIQVNGKLRGKILVFADIAKEEALAQAKENENVIKFLEGKNVVKEIFVPGKIVNLVVK